MYAVYASTTGCARASRAKLKVDNT